MTGVLAQTSGALDYLPTLLTLGFGLATIGVAIWAVVDMNRYPDWAWQQARQNKVVWIVAVVTVPLLGCFCCIFTVGAIVVLAVYAFAIRPRVREAEAQGPVGYGPYGPHAYPSGWPPPGAAPPGWGPPTGPGWGAPPPGPGWGAPPTWAPPWPGPAGGEAPPAGAAGPPPDPAWPPAGPPAGTGWTAYPDPGSAGHPPPGDEPPVTGAPGPDERPPTPPG